MATNQSMDQDTRVSHSKAQEAQAFWSICPKYFFCRLLECYGGHLAEPKTVKKRYFAKKKKQNKREQKKNSQVDLLWQRPAGLK